MSGAGASGTLVVLIAGLPATAWLLIVAAGGLGLAVELVFYLRHRRRWTQEGEGSGQARRGASR